MIELLPQGLVPNPPPPSPRGARPPLSSPISFLPPSPSLSLSLFSPPFPAVAASDTAPPVAAALVELQLPLRDSPVGARFPHLPRVLRVRGRGAVTAARGPGARPHRGRPLPRRRQRGADVLYGDRSYVPSLVLSMRYLHGALAAMGFRGSVKVSSAHASSVLATPPALVVPSPSSSLLLVAAARFPLSLHSVLLGDDAASSSSSQLPLRASPAGAWFTSNPRKNGISWPGHAVAHAASAAPDRRRGGAPKIFGTALTSNPRWCGCCWWWWWCCGAHLAGADCCGRCCGDGDFWWCCCCSWKTTPLLPYACAEASRPALFRAFTDSGQGKAESAQRRVIPEE
ncbi:hypothetical protein PVAP13_7NG304800 [Panicum virgatum]|uniref:Uncharacterized protein n=1 Tax=Panicum virgatum TaxID=38727 RepID=A0A8T0Q094_PANVG|nr:hypothetical protein PVAP13_7NG304800 [Panicum virgatum]